MASKSRRNARTGLLTILTAAALGGVAAPAGAAPTLVMQKPATGETTGPVPTFSGASTDDLDPVRVLVHEGSDNSGATVRTPEATPELSGHWTTAGLPFEGLPAGTYTAEAEQTELAILPALGETTTTEPPVTFTVDTSPPHVTIVGPKSPSGDRTPSFSGEASEAGEVVVHVLEGTKQVETATAMVKDGEWSATLATDLKSGKNTFTAFATEASGLGNKEGESSPVSFEVDTEKSTVTIVAPPSPSKDQMPSFKGTASEAGKSSSTCSKAANRSRRPRGRSKTANGRRRWRPT